jgi:hypothetical protein
VVTIAALYGASGGIVGPRALESNVVDVQDGTTAEGIQRGTMAGTVDIVLRCLTGLRAVDVLLREQDIELCPGGRHEFVLDRA